MITQKSDEITMVAMGLGDVFLDGKALQGTL
jgi:hypothetical protein